MDFWLMYSWLLQCWKVAATVAIISTPLLAEAKTDQPARAAAGQFWTGFPDPYCEGWKHRGIAQRSRLAYIETLAEQSGISNTAEGRALWRSLWERLSAAAVAPDECPKD